MEASCSFSPASLIIHHRSRPCPAHHRSLAVSATAARWKIPSSAVTITNLYRPPTQSFPFPFPFPLPLPLPRHYAQPCLRRPPPRKAISAFFQRFNERAIKAVVLSLREAQALGESVVGNQHLLLGLVAEDRSPGGFLDSGITIDRAREAVHAGWTVGSASEPASSLSAAPVYFSVSTKRVFEAALECARNMAFNRIGPEHIALSLLNADDDSAVQVLRSLGADLIELALVAHSRLQGKLAKDAQEPLAASHRASLEPIAGKRASLRSPDKPKDKSPLTQFCVDLTARASKGLIDPVIGRDTELQRIIQILCRRTKNNPILLGDAGVGKTAIVEGLARRIACAEVPSFLVEKRILSLDVGLLMAGAKERGELEARVTGLRREVQKSGDIILFIDEVHTIIGAGSVGRGNRASGLDISNLLKPALGRGKLQCIASTTFDEHKIHFEKDKALARRFQPVFIGEPCQEDTVKILLGLREKYEIFHKCRFTLEAINAAVYLSARYIPDRHLPDKAIDLIDEAGSRARMIAFKRKKEQQLAILSKAPEEYWQEIRAVQIMHEVILANKLEASMNQKITENCGNVDNVRELSRLPSSCSLNYDEEHTVGPDEIAKVASIWSGIPVQQLNADERKTLLGLDDELKKRVIGQDDAVSAISLAVKRSRVGLSAPGRPISVMLFCGPTGVGKTELTKALAASYFGSEEAMLRLDMSEYMERHSVSKLVGSPPGYIGYGEGDTLTEAVRRKPFTIILLDEIEKAHPDIFHILFQIFEDGHLTDSQGRRVSFKNTLIVMTSNLGSEAMSKGKRSFGFFLSEDNKSNSYAAMKTLVMEELKTFFLPELLNRIDEVVVFRALGKAQMLEILNVMLKQVERRLKSLGINIQVYDAMKDLVCQQGYNGINYGARPLRRAVTRLIEDVISEAILAGDCHPGDTIVLDVDAAGNPTVTRPPDQTMHLSDATSPLQ